MKKLLSIPLAMFILLSGMHFTIAKHICKGEITSVNWSFFNEENAGCGMEENLPACSVHDTFESGCCDNDTDIFSMDSEYSISTFQIKKHIKAVELSLCCNSGKLFQPYTAGVSISSNSPPNPYSSAVSLASICIFRI